MTYNNSFSENLFSYVNNINTHEGGTHLTGFRRGLTNTLKKYADSSGMLENSSSTSAGRFREGLTAVVSVKVAEPQFKANQDQARKRRGQRSSEPGRERHARSLP